MHVQGASLLEPDPSMSSTTELLTWVQNCSLAVCGFLNPVAKPFSAGWPKGGCTAIGGALNPAVASQSYSPLHFSGS